MHMFIYYQHHVLYTVVYITSFDTYFSSKLNFSQGRLWGHAACLCSGASCRPLLVLLPPSASSKRSTNDIASCCARCAGTRRARVHHRSEPLARVSCLSRSFERYANSGRADILKCRALRRLAAAEADARAAPRNLFFLCSVAISLVLAKSPGNARVVFARGGEQSSKLFFCDHGRMRLK